MKRFYPAIMMLAMMVAALGLVSCGGDDGEETGGGGSGNSGEKQVSIYLQQAGTLSSIISKTQASNLLRLKISGHMDARDFDFIKWDCMKVEEVDLSEVVIDSYSGVEGTEEGNNKTYAANEIPPGAFFYWSNVHKYIYDGMPVDEGMASLKKIILPNGIKAIRRNAFARAYNLTEINIPDGVESIDYVAFAICTSLEEIKLPASLKTVGKQAFAGMTNIKRFYVDAQTPPSALNNSFDGIPSNAVLYVPSGTEYQYRSAAGWNRFTNIVGQGDTPGDNTSYEAGWQIITDDFDKSIPFTKIRVLNKKASIGSYCCIAFSTVPNENVNTDRYYVSFGVLAIGDNMIHDLVHGIPISSCTYVGDNWYEYEFSRPVYFAYYQENCPRGQVKAYITDVGGGGGSSSSFTIAYDGDTKEYEADFQESYSEGIFWDSNKHYFYIGLLKPHGNVIIQFPSSMNASDFKAGTKFVDYSFQWTSYAGGIWNFDGEYIAGSAVVKSNDGMHIVVSFSNFSFNLSSKEVSKTHTMTIDGTIRFKI